MLVAVTVDVKTVSFSVVSVGSVVSTPVGLPVMPALVISGTADVGSSSVMAKVFVSAACAVVLSESSVVVRTVELASCTGVSGDCSNVVEIPVVIVVSEVAVTCAVLLVPSRYSVVVDVELRTVVDSVLSMVDESVVDRDAEAAGTCLVLNMAVVGVVVCFSVVVL